MPQDLRDRTYYLSNGVIRVGGRRVATNAANFTKGDIVGVVLDADQGEIVFFRNGERHTLIASSVHAATQVQDWLDRALSCGVL